jgi:hypothetical protein
MKASEAKALADVEQPRLAKLRAQIVAADLTKFLSNIQTAASRGEYSTDLCFAYPETVTSLKALGYTVDNREISWKETK